MTPRRAQRRAPLRRARLVLLACLCAGLGACGGGHAKHTRHAGGRSGLPPVTVPALPHVPAGPAVGPSRPNIVFVLTDDLSLDLLRFMPHVQAMQRAGMTFQNYFVTDSLCCPSRASIFTGDFPHNTHVFGNFGPHGGFAEFHRRGEEAHTFPVALQRTGYLTAMMGKYLNGYLPTPGQASDGARAARVARSYVPPGWSEWDVAGIGYPEFDYQMNQNGSVRYAGHRPADYLTDVLARLGVAFIDRAAAAHRPFFLEEATFAPHEPYVPAPRDRAAFPGLKAPRPPNFNRLPLNPPRWLADHQPLTRRHVRLINRVFRRRAQSVLAVDRMIGELEQALAAHGLAQDTYLVFSSDNGLHAGQYRLLPGKLTAYDTDIHVPLVVVGPRVPAGAHTDRVAENIDLAETFAQLAGTRLAGDGHSLEPLLFGRHPRAWRRFALIEHRGTDMSGLDPDFQRYGAGFPRTYEALRGPSFLYVEYDDGELEYYDLRRDPFELDNIAGQLPARRLARLHRALLALERCHGRSCWGAKGP